MKNGRSGSDFTDAWRAELVPYLIERGAKAELARWLEQNLGGTFETRQVQLARFLAGSGADSEFVLAVQEWLTHRPSLPAKSRSSKKRGR